MKVAKYIRVSTIEQNTERQEDQNVKMYIDKISGSIPFAERPAGKKLIKDIESGNVDYLEVHSIDRLGRNLRDILKTIDFLKENNCNLKINNLGLEMLDSNNKTSLTFSLISSIFGTIAEMEREQIKERQKEGIAIAKVKGTYKGRAVGSVDSIDKLVSKHNDVVKCYKKKMSIRETALVTKKSPTTIAKVYKVLKEQ